MQLYLFWKDGCESCAKARTLVEREAASRQYQIASLDARSPEAGPLIMRYEVSSLPYLVLVTRPKKGLATITHVEGRDLLDPKKLAKHFQRTEA